MIKRIDKPLKYFIIVTALFITFIGIFAVATFTTKTSPAEGYIFIDEDHPLMIRAKSRAAITRDTMRTLFQFYPENTFVRFAFEPTRGHTEHLWGRVLMLDSARVTVKVLRKKESDDIYYPDELELKQSRIEDWLVEISEKEIRGGFTSQAMLILETQKSNANIDSISRQLDTFQDKLE